MTDVISDIVNVTITRETTTVSADGFGVPMILGTHKKWNDRIKFYSSLDEVVTDGFSNTDKEYIAAAAMFGQSPHVPLIAIGRRSVDVATVTVSTVDDTALYSISINGVAYTYQATNGNTGTNIAAGLKTAINAASLNVTADNSGAVLTLTAGTANLAWTLTVGTKLTISTYVASDSMADDLTAIDLVDSNWYALVLTSRTDQHILDAAAWIEASIKIFGVASANAACYDSGSTTDIAYLLFAQGYERTFVMYQADAATTYPEAAWMGREMAALPGSNNWAFKNLSGVAATNLTTTQRTNLYAKKANSYETRGGVNITKNGTMVSGEYIDVVIGLDWLTSEMATGIFNRLANLPKIPFTNAGLAAIQADMLFTLNKAVSRGVLSPDTPPTVTMPALSSISANDKAARRLTGVTFFGVLAGAINAITIAGVVTV